MSDIKINVLNADQSTTVLEAPTDMNLSLMELLKGSGYDIEATCGGMALCATCHVEVMTGFNELPEPGPDENAMLDTLPQITPTSRLSCQLRLTPQLNGITVRILG